MILAEVICGRKTGGGDVATVVVEQDKKYGFFIYCLHNIR